VTDAAPGAAGADRSGARWDPLLRRAPLILFLALCVVAVVGLLRYRTDAAYDTLSALIWARELVHGHVPDYSFYRAPTPHPLLIGVAIPLLLLGKAASTAMVALSVAGLLALVAGTYRLAKVGAGVLGGVAAAAIVATRLDFWWLASVAYLDIPYAAMIVWAAALEAERPRRGGAVWVLLVLAGLLRPEAWLLAGVYVVWMGWRADNARRARYVAYAAIAPVVWCLTDLLVTGNPLFSLFYTNTLAAELHRDKPLLHLPYLMLYYLYILLKAPVFLMAVLGLVLAWVRRKREFIVPVVLVVTTGFTYLVIASGGLATVWRYLLLAAIGLAVFAGYALTGWTQMADGSRWRPRWAVASAVAVALGVLWTAVHIDPRWIDRELELRARLRTSVEQLVDRPQIRAALRCGPLSVPNHKLIPALRWYLDMDGEQIIARSDLDRPAQTGGVALAIATQFERRPDLNVYEAPVDEPKNIQVPPPGFTRIKGTRYYRAYTRCP